jgi:hypothetical protein
MPSIRYLVGTRQRFGDCLAISTASIASDNRDRRMSCEPGPRGILFPIWKQCHGPAPFEIADDCPVSLAASEREIIDADDGEPITWLLSPPTHDTQQGIIAHRHRQAIGKGSGRPAAQCQSQVMNDGLKASGPPRQRSQHGIAKPLGKDPAAAKNGIAPEPTNRYPQDNSAARNRQIGNFPHISALRSA